MMQKLLVLCVFVATICAAPLQPVVQQLQATHLSPIQRQLLALQQIQMLQRLTAANTPAAMNPTPVLLLLPNFPTIQNINDVINNPNEISAKEYPKIKTNTEETENEDSVVINAKNENIEAERLSDKTILLLPNRARFSIGEIISYIPFLPIEVNVPDTISWIYNGIAGIIAGIGQRLPFKRPQNPQKGQDNLRILLKHQELQQTWQQPMNILPILIVPIDAPIVSMKNVR